jgi:hypothetical protein
MLRRSCLILVLLFGGMFALYVTFFTRYFEWPGNLIAGGLGSLFGTLGLGGISHLIFVRRDTRAFRRAARREPFADGTIVAAAGPIRPVGFPLTSPFSQRPCVAYEYEVMARSESTARGQSEGAGADIAGFAMTACIVETPTGGVRLFGFPMLDEFPKTRTPGRELAERARAYAASTSFERLTGIHKLRMLFGLDDALTDDDGIVRKDFRLTDDPIPYEQRRLGERVVEVGQPVCAVGYYDASKRALIPRGATVNRLWPGTADAVHTRLVKEARSQARVGLALFVISHAFLGLAFYLSETRYARLSEREQVSAMQSAVQSDDPAELERVLRRGANPNALDSFGDPYILGVQKARMVEVLARHGADVNARDRDLGSTPLMKAIGDGDIERVRVLLAAGANVHVTSKSGLTALAFAEDIPRPEIVALLRAAGAGADVKGEPVERPRPSGR